VPVLRRVGGDQTQTKLGGEEKSVLEDSKVFKRTFIHKSTDDHSRELSPFPEAGGGRKGAL